MGIIGYLISLAIVGLIIGALGRLLIPGPNPMSVGATIGLGLIGAIVGGMIGGALGLGAISIIFEVAISAGLVYMVSNRGRSLLPGGRRLR